MLKLQEKVAYGLGDFACSMFWKLFSTYLLFFYTDVVGISAAAVGTMLLVTRVWDSANDPMMGMIADRTVTRWGKFRPYLLFVAVPFAIVGILTFTAPDLSSSGKLIYTYVTYTLMMMVYTAVNVPYAALLGVMSEDTNDRTSLASWRFIGGYSGGLLVAATANPLIEYLSAERSEASAYQLTIGFYSILASILFVFVFAGTKERLHPATQKTSTLKDDLRDLARNIPWFIMLGACIAVLIYSSIRDAALLYYFKYYVGDQDVWLFGQVSQSNLAAAFMSSILAASIFGVIITKPVAARIGKKNTFMLSGIISAIFGTVFFFLQPTQIILIFVINTILGVAGGMVMPLVWAMYADVSDYSEWKTGRRATGLIFSSSSMSQKIGWTLGGAISAWLLAGFGFEANVEQSEGSLLGIRLMMSIISAVGALVSVAFMYFYPLDEETMQEIEGELKAIRAESSDAESSDVGEA